MTTQSTPQPEPDETAKSGTLPMIPPAATPPAETVEADPLAKWRAAREMEEEMNDLFDEDRVVHRHGDSEPESD